MPKSLENYYGIVSAIWILACNDDNPIMTYESVFFRLNLDSVELAKSIVSYHPELFRTNISEFRLKRWKQNMLEGKDRPAWIKEIDDPAAQRLVIEALSRSDVFRCQFRTLEREEKASLEILKWGLEHLERQRKATIEGRDLRIKSYQMIALLVIGILNIVVTIATKIFWP